MRGKPPKIVPWTPFAPATMPGYDQPANEDIFKNSRYTVIRRTVRGVGPDGAHEMVHLSIKRNDRRVIHDWRDLQRIKNELFGPEEEMVEIYPAESRLVDTANQYHLWGVRGVPITLGYHDGRLVSEDESMGNKQRKFEDRPDDLVDPEEFRRRAQEHINRKHGGSDGGD